MALDSRNSEVLSLRLFTRDVTFSKNLTKAEQRLLAFSQRADRTFKMIGIQALAAGTAMGMLGKSIIGINTEFEALRFKLGVLFKDMEKGRRTFAEILEFAQVAPTSAKEVVETVVLLESFGMNWRDMIRDVGDLASAMQKPFTQVAEAFGRIRAGMVGQGLLSFATMGISRDALREVGVEFTKVGSLVDRSAAGITKLIQGIQTVIQSRFPNMMEKMAGTAQTMFTNIGDAWDKFRDIVGQKLFMQIKRDLRTILDWLSAWMKSPEFDRFADRLGQSFTDVYNFLVRDFGPDVIAVFKKIVESEAFKTLSHLFLAAARNLDKILILAVLNKALQVAIKLRVALTGLGLAAGGPVGLALAGGAAALGFYGYVGATGAKAGQPGAKLPGPVLRRPQYYAMSAHEPGVQAVEELRAQIERLQWLQSIQTPVAGIGGGPSPVDIQLRTSAIGKIAGKVAPATVEVGDPFEKWFGVSYSEFQETLDVEQAAWAIHVDERIQLEEKKKDAILKIASQMYGAEMKMAQGAMNVMFGITQGFTEFRKASIKEIGRIATIAVYDEVAAYLQAKATQWSAEALAALGSGLLGNPAGFAAAAKFAAAATAAGVGVTLARNQSAGIREDIQGDLYGPAIATYREEAPLRGSGGGRRIGGTIRAENLSVTISPVVSIQGDTILIGSMGVEELKDSIGDATVMAVQDALDSGGINLSRAMTGGR